MTMLSDLTNREFHKTNTTVYNRDEQKVFFEQFRHVLL